MKRTTLFKRILTFLLVLLAFPALSQPGNRITEKTRKHINIPGTKIFIVPPQDYKPSTGEFTGIEKDAKNFMRIYDMPGDRYDQQPDYRAAIERAGGLVFEDRTFQLNGHQARFLYVQEEPGRRLCALLMGDSTFCATLIAAFPSLDEKAMTEIKASLETVYYDKALEVDPFYNTIYTINDSRSQFKYAKTGKNFLVYNRGGIVKENYGNGSVMLFCSLPDTNKTGEELVEYFLDQNQKAFEITGAGIKANLQVNGRPAYEAWYYINFENKKKLLYLLAVPGTKRSVVVQCFAPEDYENELKEFKKLAYTLKFKNR